MSVERPTFHESWRRVAALRPRLRSTAQVTRQRFRGETWRVVRDPSSNQFYRLSEPGYAFVGQLDGRRAVGDAWRIACERLGDEAPTQGEAIQLLGQLWTSNLLQGEVGGDAESVFERHRKRRLRELRGRLASFVSLRIPLVDPDRFLDRWAWLVGPLFTPAGFAMWAALVLVGLYHMAGRAGDLAGEASHALSAERLPLLYACIVGLKALHELGHAFACKVFGRRSGMPGAGEVHAIGLLVFFLMPLPYADVSSSWTLRSRTQRIVVAAAGMMSDLAIASIAALVWARTGPGSALHEMAYNLIFLAGVSTLLFNGNPLLRYDGYFILSDLLGIANLSQRANEQLYYLVKRRIWGVRRAVSPADTPGERRWLAVYAVVAGAYRIAISAVVLYFVAQRFLIFGALMALAGLVMWVLVPIGRFIHYLATSEEIARVRARAVVTAIGAGVLCLVSIGLIPMPDGARATGVVEPRRMAVVYAGADGFVTERAPSGSAAGAPGSALVRAESDELVAERGRLAAELAEIEARRRLALTDDPAAAQVAREQADAARDRLARVDRDIERLTARAPLAGVWITPQDELAAGAFARRGDALGVVVDPGEVIIRAAAPQDIAARLAAEADPRVEIRVMGRPGDAFVGAIERIAPAGQEGLPSEALGYDAGGAIRTGGEASSGRAASPFFEVRIAVTGPLHAGDDARLLAGQRVVVRFDTPRRPLLDQWVRALRQLVLRHGGASS